MPNLETSVRDVTIQEILTPKDVACMLQVSVKTVHKLPIPQVRLGTRTVRYLREDVLHYLRKARLSA